MPGKVIFPKNPPYLLNRVAALLIASVPESQPSPTTTNVILPPKYLCSSRWFGCYSLCLLLGCEGRYNFEPVQKLHLLNLNIILFYCRGDQESTFTVKLFVGMTDYAYISHDIWSWKQTTCTTWHVLLLSYSFYKSPNRLLA